MYLNLNLRSIYIAQWDEKKNVCSYKMFWILFETSLCSIAMLLRFELIVRLLIDS